MGFKGESVTDVPKTTDEIVLEFTQALLSHLPDLRHSNKHSNECRDLDDEVRV
jgi:hypothetical protein